MVKVISRRMRYGLRVAIADGLAKLVAAGSPGAIKTTAGFVASDLLKNDWQIEETNGASDDGAGVWFYRLIPVKQIVTTEHESAGPPETKAVTKDEVLNMVDAMEEGEELDSFAKTLNNGEYLRQVAKYKPKKGSAESQEALIAKFMGLYATDAGKLAEFGKAAAAKELKPYLHKTLSV